MPLPTYKDVDLALLLELVRAIGPLRPAETYERVSRHFPNLTEVDLALTRADGRTKIFQNIVHWSRNHLRERGLLVVDRPGAWQTNQMASQALTDDLVFRGASRDSASSFIDSQSGLAELLGPHWSSALLPRQIEAIGNLEREPPNDLVPVEAKGVQAVAPAPDRDADAVRMAVLDRLNIMSGVEFEQFVARVLDGAGLRNSQVVGRAGDEGVDIVADLFSPFITAKVAVQVKRHAANIGPRDISYLRDRWARRADRLLFITTSDFTAGAREVASDQQEKQVTLVNGKQLVSIMFDQNLGIRERPVVTYEIDEEYFAL
jgi:restriction endonuclease Mrr